MNARIDCHVHLVGNGCKGCWLRLDSVYHRTLARIMLREMKLQGAKLEAPFAGQYAERISSWAKESSLSHIMLLAQEQPYDDSGRVLVNRGTMHVSNDCLFDACHNRPHFLPVVSIHPARPDALDELDRCIERGAFALKLLPNCQNVRCSDKRFTAFWQRLADAGMPFLAHTGGELAVEVIDSSLGDPRNLALPLECGVNVLAAHCATSSHYFDRDYSQQLGDMLQRFPNLFVDNSGLNTPLRSQHFPVLLREPFLSRMVHGSDVPIPISALWVCLRGLIGWSSFVRIRKIVNPFERDVEIKRALGFPEETFTKLANIARPRLDFVTALRGPLH